MFSVDQVEPDKSYSAGELARMAGVGRKAVQNWLASKGVAPVPLPTLHKRFRGSHIRAAFAADGHGAPVVRDQYAELLATK